jgi:hypothetical protein
MNAEVHHVARGAPSLSQRPPSLVDAPIGLAAARVHAKPPLTPRVWQAAT